LGLVRSFAEFLLRLIDKGLVKLRPKKGLRSPALAKIALEILHIFGRNFRNSRNYKIVQKFASHAGLLNNYLQQPNK